MRFFVDECTGPAVADWLRQQNHEVFSVFEQSRGMNDEDIIFDDHFAFLFFPCSFFFHAFLEL